MEEFEGQLRGAVAKLCASPSPEINEEPEQEPGTQAPEKALKFCLAILGYLDCSVKELKSSYQNGYILI